MEREFTFSNLLHAGNILHIWLEGSDFDCDNVNFIKLNKDAKWIDFIKLFDKKLNEYKDSPSIIEISLSPEGIIFREINGKQYKHDFKNDGLKTKIINFLANKFGYMQTSEIQKFTKSINTKSLSEAVRQINAVMEQGLKLPKSQNLILSKRGSGYKINPLYNIITID